MDDKEIIIKPEQKTRIVGLADREVDVMQRAMGIRYGMVPRKVINPDHEDLEKIITNLNVKDESTKQALEEYYFSDNFSEGYTDIKDKIIYETNHRPYQTIGGFEDLLGNISPASLHETAHIWVIEQNPSVFSGDDAFSSNLFDIANTGDLKKAEELICQKVWSEGMAVYMVKRCNDYLKQLVTSYYESEDPNNYKLNSWISETFERYNDAEHTDPTTIFEDYVLAQRMVNRVKKGDVKLEDEQEIEEFFGFFTQESYRLGFNMVSRVVDKLMEDGKSEAEVLSEIARKPVKSLKEIKDLLVI
jgi:hypothetical protein